MIFWEWLQSKHDEGEDLDLVEWANRLAIGLEEYEDGNHAGHIILCDDTHDLLCPDADHRLAIENGRGAQEARFLVYSAAGVEDQAGFQALLAAREASGSDADLCYVCEQLDLGCWFYSEGQHLGDFVICDEKHSLSCPGGTHRIAVDTGEYAGYIFKLVHDRIDDEGGSGDGVGRDREQDGGAKGSGKAPAGSEGVVRGV